MATSPFDMDGQSDEDFFDKLVDDDYTITKSDYSENKTNSLQLESAHSTQIAEDEVSSASDALAKLVLDESEANLVAYNGSGKASGINELCQVESAPAEDQKAEDGPAEGLLSMSGQELAFAYVAKGGVVDGSAEFDALNTTIKPVEAEKVEVSNGDGDDGNYKNQDLGDSLSRQSSHKSESGKICTNVREVQWSNFNSLSTEGDLGGFGSYSDFFKDLPSNSMEQAGESGLDFFSMVPQVEDNSVSLGQPITDLTTYQLSQAWEKGTLEATATAATQPELRSFSEIQAFNGQTNDMQQNYYKNGQLEEHFTGSTYADQSHGTNLELPSAGDNQNAYYSQDWENAYPGWKYDHTTGEWHQVMEGYEAMPVGEVGNGEVVSEDNSQPTQSTVNYSIWQAQGSQSYNGGSAGDSVHHVESITGEVPHLLQTGSTNSSLAQVSTGQAVSTEQAVPGWEQYSQNVAQDQQNIYFDPQYPGWYYDFVLLEWRQVSDNGGNSYTSGVSIASFEQPEVTKLSNSAYAYDDLSSYSQSNQFHSVHTQSPVTQLSESSNDYAMSNGKWEVSAPQDNMYGNIQHHGGVFNNNVSGQNLKDGFFGNQSKLYHPSAGIQGELDQSTNFQIPSSVFPYDQANHSFSSHQNDFSIPSSDSGQNVYSYSSPQVSQSHGFEASHNYYGNVQTVSYPHQINKVGQHANHTTPFLDSFMEGRSSAGRPPHALVTFGFGGKLVVFNPNDRLNVTQDHCGVLRVHSLGQLVTEKLGNESGGIESGYFHSLCRQAFSSPLAGGNVSNKEMFKWIDERIASCEFATPACRNPELMHMLLCSLKIFCKHYGKLRSTFSVGGASQETDGPEVDLTKLFASAKSYGSGLSKFSASTQCLQAMPSASEFQATALEMKNLLVAGKRKEALLHAQQGQLWGPALVLAWQLGEKFYVDTVTQMAQQQFLPGSPLRTLCLLLAGQPAEVFSANKLASSTYSYSGSVNGMQQSDQDCMSGMLNDWQENLAIITANRTKGDERVIVHLGDCLWKERGEVAAAHTCYLVAEASFEYFSDTARLCLIGADHLKYPRTYASPDAIQRTELYEYAKVLGNPQHIFLSFQPYKLIYASMLAEIGKVSDALRYCQAVSKILKNAGRAPEVEACREFASSLEDRIRVHTQGGYSSNLAPSKLMGRFLTTIDRSIHRIIGAPPPPMPSDSQSGLQISDSESYSSASKVANASHPPNATPLMPSVSMEPLSEWAANNGKTVMQTRSVSEPDFSRSPKENQSSFGQNQSNFNSKGESDAAKANSKITASSGQSRFGRFGSQIFQKAVGLIAKTHNNEAKLGDKNKFYYDEKLKRWVEEGAAPPAEEAVLSAPPISAAFITNAQTPESSYNIGSALNGQTIHNGGVEIRSPLSSEKVSGMPPVPPSVNQFSARGRLHGVRSRYVDTFNKGGGSTPTKSFQAPVIPAAGPLGLPSKANFFIPNPAASLDSNSNEVAGISDENGLGAACTSATEDSSGVPTVSRQESGSAETLPRGVGSMHRYSSADNVTQFAENRVGHVENGSVMLSSHSRAASWSGGYPDSIKQSEEPEALRTPEGNKISRFSNMPGRVPGYFSNPTKLDAERPGSGGFVHASLPSPPPIEPPHSTMVFKQSLVADGGNRNNIYKQMSHGLQSGIQADSFGDDLQEVEL